MNHKKVSIFGCGWVGRALVTRLENEYAVMASVQSEASYDVLDTENKFLINTSNDFYNPTFYDTDILIIAIPPRGEYLHTLCAVLSSLQVSTQVILLSSTSVYTQVEGEVSEIDTDNIVEPSSLMLQAERLVQSKRKDVLVLRLAGLMGYDRIAGKYTAGKSIECDSPVNYVHRDDVVEIIKIIIDKDIRAEVFNVAAPLHPTKKAVYEHNVKYFGFEPTQFKSAAILGKRVSSKKLIKYLDYTFQKMNPLTFW